MGYYRENRRPNRVFEIIGTVGYNHCTKSILVDASTPTHGNTNQGHIVYGGIPYFCDSDPDGLSLYPGNKITFMGIGRYRDEVLYFNISHMKDITGELTERDIDMLNANIEIEHESVNGP